MTEPRVAVVTPRQREVVVELAADGASNKDIAERLGISYECVRSHMARVLHSTGYDNRTALAVALVRGRIRLRVEDDRGRT